MLLTSWLVLDRVPSGIGAALDPARLRCGAYEMIELVPCLFYVALAMLASRSCAIIAARRIPERRPSEEFLAGLDMLPGREMSVARETVAVCYAVLRESGLRGWPAYFAVLHVASWAVLLLMILVIAMVGLVRQF